MAVNTCYHKVQNSPLKEKPCFPKTASEIEGLTGNPVLPLQCDVRDPEAIKATVDTVVDQLGLPNVVVNNAAGNFISPTERLSPKGFKNIVDIVLNGTMMVTLDIGKRLIAAGQGAAFLAITAHISNEGSAFVVPSATSKSGVETMMKSLGVEWGKYGIRMNCIAPGIFYTEGAFSRLDPTEALIKDHIKIIPAGRLGEVEEIANLATYLCSDYASWVNAETVTLDGGEFRGLAGEFNKLMEVPMESWDMLEKMIRSTNKKSKE